jgi:uncharacterized protein involved in tolerance to divalent cations
MKTHDYGAKPLKPLLVRLTEKEHERLNAEVKHRATIGLHGYIQPNSKAEIVRQALEHYLSWIEAERKKGLSGR